jgi:hypothetical protein
MALKRSARTERGDVYVGKELMDGVVVVIDGVGDFNVEELDDIIETLTELRTEIQEKAKQSLPNWLL